MGCSYEAFFSHDRVKLLPGSFQKFFFGQGKITVIFMSRQVNISDVVSTSCCHPLPFIAGNIFYRETLDTLPACLVCLKSLSAESIQTVKLLTPLNLYNQAVTKNMEIRLVIVPYQRINKTGIDGVER